MSTDTSPRASTGAASVSAVVVSFNSAARIGDCLASLQAAGVGEIVVVDNASSDNSRAVVEAVPGVRWHPTGSNLGYGRAANVGAALTDGRYVLVCNPDLVIKPDAVEVLAAAAERLPRAGIVAPLLRNHDGTIYPSARIFPDLIESAGHGLLGLVAPDNRFTRKYRRLDWDHADEETVEWVSGACMLVRREAWDQVGGFDPAYFMYLEDVDLCWRIGRAGWEVRFEPRAEALHIQGESTRQHPYRMLLAHHRSLWRFARQSTTGPKRAALPLVAVGLVGHLVLGCILHRMGSIRGERGMRIP